MKRKTKTCPKCGKEISLSNFKKHVNACGNEKKATVTVDQKWLNPETGKYACPYCDKEFTKNGICTHIMRTHMGLNPVASSAMPDEHKERIRKGVIEDHRRKIEEKIKAWYAGEWDGSVQSGASKTIRNHLLEKHGNKCEECGWGKVNKYTGTVSLEIHHVDGDHRNNRPENLQVLCLNCHSLTPNYRNAGGEASGREYRKKYKSRRK